MHPLNVVVAAAAALIWAAVALQAVPGWVDLAVARAWQAQVSVALLSLAPEFGSEARASIADMARASGLLTPLLWVVDGPVVAPEDGMAIAGTAIDGGDGATQSLRLPWASATIRITTTASLGTATVG